MWCHHRSLMSFETSFGTLAWEGPTTGRTRVFERDGDLLGWARLTPGYERIRRAGAWDVAPPSLVWLVDRREPAAAELLVSIIEWAEERSDLPFSTSHARGDDVARDVLAGLGYGPDPTEPFGIYMQQPLSTGSDVRLDGYVLATMAALGDAELRAEAHRLAWEGSTRSADDVRATMAQWPYRADLDIVVTTVAGDPAGSALIWFDETYQYGELEPVGVAAGHRGRGIAGAMLRFGLGRLAAAGASYAVVGARGDDDYPLPRRVYASAGFRTFTTQQMVRKG
jgi:GNAT superfamily N-acetyltransferase